jgi:Protein of unknown function (DUF4245)
VAVAATKKRGSATVRDMVLSLAVVGAAIGLFVFLLPKTPHQKVTPVEFLPTAQAIAADTKTPVLAPQPVPDGWQANYVRVGAGDSFHVGFVLDAKRFAQLDETGAPNAAFYSAAKVPLKSGGATAADLATNPPAGYQIRREGSHVALVHPLAGGGVLTLSDGGTSTGASLPELVTLARSMRQVTPST